MGENVSEGKTPVKGANDEDNAASPNGTSETNATAPTNDASFDASAATQLMISCYPSLGPNGQRITNDPDLIARAVELVTSAQFTTPCDEAAWREKTAGTSGGYSASLSLLGADGNTLIHIMHNPSLEQLGVAAKSVFVRNEDGAMLLISDDQEPLVSFLDECVTLAKSETDTSKAPGFDNPDNTWHFV